MVMSKDLKKKVIADFKRDRRDAGSVEIQVALLTQSINDLSKHFETHVRDHHSRRGLIQMVSKRRKLLDYLNGTEPNRYKELITRLNIRK